MGVERRDTKRSFTFDVKSFNTLVRMAAMVMKMMMIATIMANDIESNICDHLTRVGH